MPSNVQPKTIDMGASSMTAMLLMNNSHASGDRIKARKNNAVNVFRMQAAVEGQLQG
jgi:hypothetical protein